MKSPDVNKVAALIAEVAATEIQPRFRKLAAHEQREKGPGDIVQQALDQVAWIVDPVDGTANFAEGKEEFVSMVALVRGDELIGSWIHLPMTGHTAIAERGAGATYDGARIPKLSPEAPDLAGVVGVGKFSAPSLHPRAEALRRQVKQIKSLRCAGLDYLRLARGELDFILFGRAWPWDHAPGALLVAEVGGVASHGDSSPYRPSQPFTKEGVLTARSPQVWRQILDRLNAQPAH